MPDQATVLWDVAQEHLDEAEFLVEAWLAATRSPRLSLADVQRTVERRLLAHLDGLVVGGPPVADELLWPALADDSDAPPTRIAAAALALTIDAAPKTQDRLLDVFGKTDDPVVRGGLGHAFRITPRADIDEKLRQALYATEKQEAQAILLDVLAARRLSPGPSWTRCCGEANHVCWPPRSMRRRPRAASGPAFRDWSKAI